MGAAISADSASAASPRSLRVSGSGLWPESSSDFSVLRALVSLVRRLVACGVTGAAVSALRLKRDAGSTGAGVVTGGGVAVSADAVSAAVGSTCRLAAGKELVDQRAQEAEGVVARGRIGAGRSGHQWCCLRWVGPNS